MRHRCEHNERSLSLLVDGDLAEPEAAPLREHLHECAGCRDEKRRLEELKAVAGRLPLDEASEHLWSRIEARLDEAQAGRGARRRWRVPVLLAAGLALFLVSREGLRELLRAPGPGETPTPAAQRLRSPEQEAEAIGKLAGMLRDPNEDVRASAAEALGLAGPAAAAAVPALIEALRDPSVEVRSLAARALGGLGAEAKASVERLRELQKDADPAVREAAAEALRKLGG
jgi:HEAT repeat protein/putative zinc finger protein